MLIENGQLDIRLFGHAEVRVCGAPLPALHSRRGLWLLALLALQDGKTISRSKLAGLLWPDTDESTALHNLRQTLSNLRGALGPLKPAIIAEPDHSLRLDVTQTRVDVHEFDAACADGSPLALQRAMELYTGPLLEGCDEAWAIEEREPRASAHLCGLERLAEERASAGDLVQAVAWLRRAAAADPYRESVRRSLMQSLAALGEFTSAQEVYRDLRATLHRDLNSQPDPMTTSVYHKIRQVPEPSRPAVTSAADAGRTPRAKGLPAARTNLIGREVDIEAVRTLLSESRLVTLTGTGGIGKTRLAMEVARRIEELSTQFDSVSFASLADVLDRGAVLTTVCAALGAQERDGRQDILGLLEHHLDGRRELIVLDNCEHVLEVCAELVDALLARSPEIRILATSRHSMGMAGEVVWRVPSLSLPPLPSSGSPSGDADISSAGEYAAVQLFVERARSADAAFRLTTANTAAVVEACLRLDGIPLAIELGASRVRSLTVAEINARLGSGFGIVAGGGPTAPRRHQTLQKAFEWSWQLLHESERTLLRRLSVFAGGWTLPAAEVVCSSGEISPADVLELLTSLVDKSLVVYLPGQSDVDACLSDQQSRYHLLQTVRQFAADRLLEAGERDEAADRHLEYFLNWAEEVRPNLWLADQAVWFEQLERDHDNLRAALEWTRLRPGGVHQEYRIVHALSRFWDTYGRLQEGSRHLEMALTRWTEEVPFGMRSQVLAQAGWVASKLGDLSRARLHFELAIALCSEAGDNASLAYLLTMLATVTSKQGDYTGARTMFEESLRIHRMLGIARPWSTLNNLGDLEMRLGNIELARSYFLESICDLDQRTKPQLMGITLCNLAEVELHLGTLPEATKQCAAAIRALQEGGAHVEVPNALELMALVAVRNGNAYRAAKLLGAATVLREQHGQKLQNADFLAETTAEAERCLGAEAYARASADGGRLSLEDAITYALIHS